MTKTTQSSKMDSKDEYIQTKEFQEDFFELLKKHKTSGVKLVSYFPKSRDSAFVLFNNYDVLSFRILICELIYNAINLFPDIYEYTITCNRSTMKIGYFDVLDDNGEPTVITITNPMGNYKLNKVNVYQLYRHNRDPDIDMETINAVSVLMILDGNIPMIKTSYKSKSGNKGFIADRIESFKEQVETIDSC